MSTARLTNEVEILAAIGALNIKLESIGRTCAKIVSDRKKQTEAAAGQGK